VAAFGEFQVLSRRYAVLAEMNLFRGFRFRSTHGYGCFAAPRQLATPIVETLQSRCVAGFAERSETQTFTIPLQNRPEHRENHGVWSCMRCSQTWRAPLQQNTNTKTKTMKTWITTLSALAMATALSFAQDKPPGPPEGGPGRGGKEGGKDRRPNPEEVFKKLDANGDGSVSLEEFKAGPAGQRDAAKAEEIFKKIDADGNGNVSAEEFKAHRPPPRGGGPGGDRPPGGPGGDRPPGGKGGKGPGGKGPGGERPPKDA
jgi:hypothetical protein